MDQDPLRSLPFTDAWACTVQSTVEDPHLDHILHIY
jgi:hypothetical protein